MLSYIFEKTILTKNYT